MINKVILIGNLGRDPEIRHLENGAAVANFSVATNENYRDKSGEWKTITEWHNIVAWRNLAERAERDLKKGSLVYIEGKLNTRKWQDRDGNDRYTTDIVALSMRPLEKRESTGSDFGSFPSASDEIPSSTTSEEPETTVNNNAESQDDDLPF